MTRVAAFDCGTNSLRLLVADLDPAAGRARELAREMRIVRLGEGVDRTGRISDVAMGRVLAAVDDFVAIARKHDVERVRFCATSAARDAENAESFMAGVRSRVGVAPEVLTGEEEARLSFTGAVRSMPGSLKSPYLVVDIGGGSTELILGEQAVQQAASLDIGSVRITERHLHSSPPTREQVAAAIADIDAVLDTVEIDLASAGSVIGVAGTVTTVAAGALRLRSYERDLIHHSVIDVASVQGTVTLLLAMGQQERRAQGYMHPGRADVIGGGGLILARLLRRTSVYSILVSEQDILDGIAWSMS
ncbi:Ppx/GppA phosphatase family protein [Nocardioides terrisoli]|uniref:Ppx/GppA phosphatase family protein n=1 Tax=Nocardioides terrisoli TaxID=3388267 RepID=UPI00287B71F5|nr:Ppx/GppA phosphatase family protein [Nocardioides marmorisolisilvae]